MSSLSPWQRSLLAFKALAISMALSMARYSALLLVISPMHSAFSRTTLPCESQITTPMAAGPGFPLAPPSEKVCSIMRLPVIRELKRKAVILVAQEIHGGLEFVFGFTGYP